MALSGSTEELSLADLLQVKAHDTGNFRFSVEGPAGPGVLFLEGGRVVHASYAGLPPQDAAQLLATSKDVTYLVTGNTPAPRRTLAADVPSLIMEAARLKDEGRLAAPMLPEAREGHRPGSRRPRELVAILFGVLSLLGLVLVGGLWLSRDRTVSASLRPPAEMVPVVDSQGSEDSTATQPAPRRPVEASDLTGPRDAAPVLLTGELPAVPDPGSPIRPTIVLRLLIDVEGAVRDAIVYRKRPELEVFETRAVEAAWTFRFSPARREGVAVPAWINWPVTFR